MEFNRRKGRADTEWERIKVSERGERLRGGEAWGRVCRKEKGGHGRKGGPGTHRQRNTHSCRVSTPISLYCSSCFTWASSCLSLESCGHKAGHWVTMAHNGLLSPPLAKTAYSWLSGQRNARLCLYRDTHAHVCTCTHPPTLGYTLFPRFSLLEKYQEKEEFRRNTPAVSQCVYIDVKTSTRAMSQLFTQSVIWIHQMLEYSVRVNAPTDVAWNTEYYLILNQIPHISYNYSLIYERTMRSTWSSLIILTSFLALQARSSYYLCFCRL